MENLSFIQIVIGAVISFVGLAGGIGLLLNAIKKKPRDEKNEVVNSANTIMEFWKGQAEEYKTVLEEKGRAHSERISQITKEFTQQVTTLTEKYGILQGQFNAEKELRMRAESILKDRNPETQKFMEFMMNTQKEVLNILQEIHKMSKDEHDRDFSITSTITKSQ